jgi:hypothetical protein
MGPAWQWTLFHHLLSLSFVVPVVHRPHHPSSLSFVISIVCHPHRSLSCRLSSSWLSSQSSTCSCCCYPAIHSVSRGSQQWLLQLWSDGVQRAAEYKQMHQHMMQTMFVYCEQTCTTTVTYINPPILMASPLIISSLYIICTLIYCM